MHDLDQKDLNTIQLKYLTMQKYDLQNNPLKETKIVQHIIIITLL
jgi:hypothetical protein